MCVSSTPSGVSPRSPDYTGHARAGVERELAMDGIEPPTPGFSVRTAVGVCMMPEGDHGRRERPVGLRRGGHPRGGAGSPPPPPPRRAAPRRTPRRRRTGVSPPPPRLPTVPGNSEPPTPPAPAPPLH